MTGIQEAGYMHHYRVNFDKYHPGYLGKVGVKHYHLKRNQSFCLTVALDNLWTLVSEQTQVKAAKNKTGVAPMVNTV
ncbi:hypothetical protein ACRRTK_005460 [Alexandromys fortis]